MSKYTLDFRLQPQNTSDLITGLLVLCKDGVEINAYIATSGLPGHQNDGDWTERGRGLIVPDEVTGRLYAVITSPIYLPNTKGVEGNFYPITPELVRSGAGQRGDFGIHFDANVPGSSGCIVLKTQRGWQAFQRDIKAIAVQGIKDVSLNISYQ